MNAQMAYLIGMILGNGELQRGANETKVTIEIPHKNLKDDEGRDIAVYVRASLMDIRAIIEPLIESTIVVGKQEKSTSISFTLSNQNYTMREILRFIGNGAHHSTMKMNEELFSLPVDERKELMRGFADVTGYIRDSNRAFNQKGQHRVYLEIPGNWDLVIDVANMLKSLDVPIQTIDFGHPNFRDSNAKKYNEGKPYFWKKEHQIKIWANEFIPIGFNIAHKQKALEKYSDELLKVMKKESTHRFYWEKQSRSRKPKVSHPMENDESLPSSIRGKHYDSWSDLASELGYHE